MSIERAYLAGVLHGDGWCTENSIGLRCKDHDFNLEFCRVVNCVYGLAKIPKTDERGYWLSRHHNNGRFSNASQFVPTTQEEECAWLRGLFDSEGNAQLQRIRRGYMRRVAIYSTSAGTLIKASGYLDSLGIKWSLNPTKNSRSHKGTKTVFELRVCGRSGFTVFAEKIGSSIARKNDALQRMVAVYQPDNSYLIKAQIIGVTNRRERRVRVIRPRVLRCIRELIDNGIKPTTRNCAKVRGFYSLYNYQPIKEIVADANAL